MRQHKIYFTMCERQDGLWVIAFGSYSLAEVKDEQDDYHYNGIPTIYFKSTDQQVDINQQLIRVNRRATTCIPTHNNTA